MRTADPLGRCANKGYAAQCTLARLLNVFARCESKQGRHRYVARAEPCKMPATPPIMMNSTSAPTSVGMKLAQDSRLTQSSFCGCSASFCQPDAVPLSTVCNTRKFFALVASELSFRFSRNNVRSTSGIKSRTLSLSAGAESITRSIA